MHVKKPIYQILENGTCSDVTGIIRSITHTTDNYYGYDALTDKFTNLKEAGILDSKEGLIKCLKSCIDLVKMLFNLDSMIFKPSVS